MELLRLCAFLDADDIDSELLTAGAAQAGQILTAALADLLERAEIAGTLAYASLVTVPCVAHRFKARASLMSAGCGWW